MTGSCLCGAVRFEIGVTSGSFELCHCNRCRKVSGSAFMVGLAVPRNSFQWATSTDSIMAFEVPFLNESPEYKTFFCKTCGSPAPDPESNTDMVEISAGLLDGDPGVALDKHIIVELKASWHDITDELCQMNAEAFRKHRGKL